MHFYCNEHTNSRARARQMREHEDTRIAFETINKQKAGLCPAFHVFGDEVASDGFLGIGLRALSQIFLLQC